MSLALVMSPEVTFAVGAEKPKVASGTILAMTMVMNTTMLYGGIGVPLIQEAASYQMKTILNILKSRNF
jgi:hypothetical protein